MGVGGAASLERSLACDCTQDVCRVSIIVLFSLWFRDALGSVTVCILDSHTYPTLPKDVGTARNLSFQLLVT